MLYIYSNYILYFIDSLLSDCPSLLSNPTSLAMEFSEDFLSGTLFGDIGQTPAQSETNLVPRMTVLAGNGRVKEEPSDAFHTSVDLSDTSDFCKMN